jgi:selenocysteine-specific elongation factor
VAALLSLSGWAGAPLASLTQATGLPPALVRKAVADLQEAEAAVQIESRLFSQEIWLRGRELVLSALREFHEAQPLRLGVPMEELRQVPPGEWGQKVGEALLQDLATRRQVRLRKGIASLEGFRPRLSGAQDETRAHLRTILEESALSPPGIGEMAETLGGADEIHEILRLMEADGEVVALDAGFFFWQESVRRAGLTLVSALGGASGLGPSDFKEVFPLSRRHLLPLLRYFDTVGITTRLEELRSVAREAPPGWGE